MDIILWNKKNPAQLENRIQLPFKMEKVIKSKVAARKLLWWYIMGKLQGIGNKLT